ncbi:MAG: tetraacyldisaccharide 4'-kinase, partial [Thermodesulfobacteria bacterium]|nr:tetraacyldisaccharide 4'-kinase [Thermodesulfobacteriota bacterium]
EEIGDEAYLLAAKSRSPVMVARDRVQGAFWAIKEFEAEVLILDDGFQHLRLERDLDLVLLSARKNPFRERVFPAGRLREPLKVLWEADALVITKTNEAPEQGARLEERLRGFKKPVFKAPFETGAPYLLGKRETQGEPPSPLLAFCGLGDPRSFLLAAEKTGEIAGFISLPDHVAYTPKLIERLLSARKKAGATAFLTTEKDAVKLLPFVEKLQPCYVLPLETRPEKELEAFILERLRKDRRL